MASVSEVEASGSDQEQSERCGSYSLSADVSEPAVRRRVRCFELHDFISTTDRGFWNHLIFRGSMASVSEVEASGSDQEQSERCGSYSLSADVSESESCGSSFSGRRFDAECGASSSMTSSP
ncbi:rop guanine nucleotide exchange factor 1 isoform X1 [Fagus crenata]